MNAKSLYGSKKRIALIAIVVLCIVLTIGLRGAVPEQTIMVVNGANYMEPLYGETGATITGYSDNLRNWTVSSSAGSSATLTYGENLLLNGSFSGNAPQRIAITKQLNVNISEFPIATLDINSSPDLQVEMDLFVLDQNGSLVQIGNQNQLTNNGSNVLRINLLYGERIASNEALVVISVNGGSGSSQFFLQINSLSFSSASTVSNTSGYHAIYIQYYDSTPSGNSSWTLNHATLGATLSASYGSYFELYFINGSTVYDEGNYTFSRAISNYEYTILPKTALSTQQIKSINASLPFTPNGSAIAFVATKGVLYNITVQYSRFVFLPVPNVSSSVYLEKSQYGYLYAYLASFLFVIPVLGSLLIYQRYRGGKLTKRNLLFALVLGAVSRLALAPITYSPYDTLVYITSARAWFQYGIANISLGPTLPLTFFLYRIPYSLYALFQLVGFHDLHFMGHSQGMLEMMFIKAFPMISDLGVFYFLAKMTKDNIGRVFGALYLLNPLSVYVSAVLGQYEAATSVFILAGLWLLVEERHRFMKILDSDFFGSVAITLSALVELFALIPLSYLIIKSFFAKPYRWLTTLMLSLPLLLFLVYPPELRLSYLVILSAAGVISTLGFATLNTYSLLSRFPMLADYHLLLLSLFIITLWFILTDNKDLGNTMLFSLGGFLCLILLGNQLFQWWQLVLPLAFAASLLSKKYSIGYFMPALGTMIAFVGLSFAQGSGDLTIGPRQIFLFPWFEMTSDNVLIVAVITTIASVLLGYFMIGKQGAGTKVLRNSSIALLVSFLIVYAIVRGFGI